MLISICLVCHRVVSGPNYRPKLEHNKVKLFEVFFNCRKWIMPLHLIISIYFRNTIALVYYQPKIISYATEKLRAYCRLKMLEFLKNDPKILCIFLILWLTANNFRLTKKRTVFCMYLSLVWRLIIIKTH